MAPLSAVAVFIFLLLFGLTEGGWATISPKVLGVIAIIVGAVVLLDTFWFRTSDWWASRRAPQQ